jgi:hypothetical protein
MSRRAAGLPREAAAAPAPPPVTPKPEERLTAEEQAYRDAGPDLVSYWDLLKRDRGDDPATRRLGPATSRADGA